ncbi:hypothetical protein SprV_1002867500 [Sparganum proliferum]
MALADVEVFEDAVPLVRSCPALNEIRTSGEFIDLSIEVKDGAILNAHRIILAARIPSLRTALSGALGKDNSVLKWPTVPLNLANSLIQYVYTGQLAMTQANAMGIVMFAKMMKLSNLENWGVQFMTNRFLNMGSLMETCINLMQAQFMKFVSSELFVHLTADTVLTMLRNDNLSVDSEEDVFEAISSWVGAGDKECDNVRLRLYAPEMLKEVRWCQTTLQFRSRLVDTHPMFQDSTSCARFMSQVEQWMSYADKDKPPCPFNRRQRPPQTIFSEFGKDKDQDRWSAQVEQGIYNADMDKPPCPFNRRRRPPQTISSEFGKDKDQDRWSAQVEQGIYNADMDKPPCPFNRRRRPPQTIFSEFGKDKDQDRWSAQVEQGIYNADKDKPTCPFNRRRRTPQTIFFVFGKDKDQDRWSAQLEQWIYNADKDKPPCPFNRRWRSLQTIFETQDRWSVLRFDSQLEKEERIADMKKREHATYSLVGESIFVVGGSTAQQEDSAIVEEFLVAERRWRKRASLVVGRRWHAAAVLTEARGEALIGVFGGCNCGSLSSCEVYEVRRDRWFKLPDLREKRNATAAACLPGDSRIFVFGGWNGSSPLASVEFCQLRADWRERATSSDFWQPVAPMRTARYGLAATHFRGKIIVAGGSDGSDRFNMVEMFTPPDARCPRGQWTKLARMKEPRAYFALLTSADDAIFALGCWYRSGNTVETFTAPGGSADVSNDLTSWIWTSKEPLETPAKIAGAASIRM